MKIKLFICKSNITVICRCLLAVGMLNICNANESTTTMHNKHDTAISNFHSTRAGVKFQRSEQSYTIPEVNLIDQYGNKHSINQLIAKGRPVLINFIFTTCPSICPVLSATFSKFQQKLGKELPAPLLISISIDPEHDTPKQLNAYAKKFHANQNWIFLTGAYESIKEVEKSLNAYRGEKMNHAPLTFLYKAGLKKWIRLEGFTSANDLLLEYQRMLSFKES
ncbi:MAG: SCO family protein [Methylococcaceae bacterium]|nr:SCO family protein [Methylococcaceae bacterium]